MNLSTFVVRERRPTRHLSIEPHGRRVCGGAYHYALSNGTTDGSVAELGKAIHSIPPSAPSDLRERMREP